MIKRHIFLPCFAALFLACLAHAAQPDLQAPMPVDPNVKMGVLPNGLRYWIRAHNTPPGKVGIWIHVSSGSINEEDNQRGLAHFLEHMAFNGTANFPPGTLVKYFESIGLRFGQHQNAFTFFDQTTYQINLPDTKDETVSKGLLCLSDFAYRMSLSVGEIDKERGVILEESRTRKGAGQRIFDKLLPLLAPGSRFAERLPIGKDEVIKVVDQQLFKDYYAKWYRPDHATVLVVGEIVPEAVEKLIAEQFSAWAKVENPAPDADPGLQPYKDVRAATITDPEQAQAEVGAQCLLPLRKVLTLGDYRAQTVDGLGTWIANRRYNELVQKGAAPFQNAHVSVGPFLNVCTHVNAAASGKPDQWAPMLLSLLVELKRAREFGFLEQELEDAKKQSLASAEQTARQESTADARTFLGGMNGAVSQGRKPTSAAQRLELLGALLPGITLEEVSAAFKRNFAPDARLLTVVMPEKEGLQAPSSEEVLALAAKAEAAPVEALVAKVRPKGLLEKDPEPGKIAEREEEPDLKILSLTLENGVRLHLRQMDFKKDLVLARINLAGGTIRENAETRGTMDVAELALQQRASRRLTSTEIRDLMVGKNVSVGGGAGTDAVGLSISGSPKHLEEGLRLAHLLLTEAKIEESAVKVWRQEKAQALEEKKTSVEGQLGEKVEELLSNGDPRFKDLTPERLAALKIEDAQRWLDDVFRGGPLEAAIVGDLDRDEMLRLALKYLGSLPARPRSDPTLDGLRKLSPRPGPLEETVEVETITPRAVVQLGWRGADWKDVQDRRVLSIAAQILEKQLREEIREKRALTYSIGCFASAAREYPGTGFFGCYFTADPEKAAEAAKIARACIETFAQNGPTEAEMATVRKQLQNALETQLKEPSYWLGVLADLDYHGTRLSDVKEVIAKMISYTQQDVLETLKRYVTEERRIQAIALPKKK